MVPQPPPTSWKPKGISLQYLLWELSLPGVILGGEPCDQVPLEFLTFRLIWMEPPAIRQSWHKLLSPRSGQPVVAQMSLQPQEQRSALCPPLSMDPRRVACFSVCSAFYLQLGGSGDIQVPYIWNRKPETLSLPSNMQFHTFLKIWKQLFMWVLLHTHTHTASVLKI